MTPHQVLVVLKARWRSALATFLLVVAGAGVANLLLEEQYTATASILLDVKSPDPIAGIILPGMNGPAYMTTQVNVIQSERVALRALDMMNPEAKEEARVVWQEETEGVGSFESWLAEGITRRLSVQPLGRESNVVMVNYTSPKPQFSTDMANAFVKAYIETSVDLRAEPAKQYNAFFDERAKVLRAELEKAQGRLSAYQQSKGLIATDERLDVENTRLIELSTQLVTLQALSDESANRSAQAGANAERMQEVLNNPLVVGLSADQARLEARLDEVSERLGDRHPQVQELKANLAQVKRKIASATSRISSSLSVNNTVNQSRLAQLRKSVEDQRDKILKLKSQRDEASVLLRDVENAQKAYDTMLQRMTQSNIESHTEQTNVSVLKSATLPVRPSSPRVKLNLAIGIVLGALLALGIALLREAIDKRLRTEEDILEQLRLPLVGVLPTRRAGRLADLRSRRLIPSRVLAALPQPTQS